MRVLRNTGQNISPSDDGRLFDQAFTDGLFNSPSITSLGSNLVQIGAMYGILCGRDFTSDAQQVTVALSDSGTKTGHIYIRFDTTTADIISVESVIGTFTPTYQDINTAGTVAEMEIASYTATELAVTAITPNYPKAQTEINETLAGSIATIETSPATANHSVGEYIVYNGQLYKVTTAITAGTTLTGKISAVSVGSELKSFSESTSLTGDNYTIYYTRIGNIVFVRGAFTYQGTYDTEISGLPSAPTIVSFIARSNGTGKKIGISLIGNRISFYMQLGDAPVSGNEYHFQFSYMTVG